MSLSALPRPKDEITEDKFGIFFFLKITSNLTLLWKRPFKRRLYRSGVMGPVVKSQQHGHQSVSRRLARCRLPSPPGAPPAGLLGGATAASERRAAAPPPRAAPPAG